MVMIYYLRIPSEVHYPIMYFIGYNKGVYTGLKSFDMYNSAFYPLFF